MGEVGDRLSMPEGKREELDQSMIENKFKKKLCVWNMEEIRHTVIRLTPWIMGIEGE